MALVIERFLICDNHCGINFGDTRSNTAKQHRKLAKKEGWQIRNGKDYCPKCIEKYYFK